MCEMGPVFKNIDWFRSSRTSLSLTRRGVINNRSLFEFYVCCVCVPTSEGERQQGGGGRGCAFTKDHDFSRFELPPRRQPRWACLHFVHVVWPVHFF